MEPKTETRVTPSSFVLSHTHILVGWLVGWRVGFLQVKLVNELSALGLRHVGYAVPVELFSPFVDVAVEVLWGRRSEVGVCICKCVSVCVCVCVCARVHRVAGYHFSG